MTSALTDLLEHQIAARHAPGALVHVERAVRGIGLEAAKLRVATVADGHLAEAVVEGEVEEARDHEHGKGGGKVPDGVGDAR